MLNFAPNLDPLLRTATAHHQAGQLPQAEAAYRQILQANPNHPVALHLLGVLAAQVGRADVALELIGRALAVDPSNPEAHCNRGKILQESKRPAEAIVSLRQALALRPNYPEALHNLGSAHYALGQLDEAAAAFRQALALRPNYAEVHYNLGSVLAEQAQFAAAIAAYRQCLALTPNFPDAHANLAGMLLLQGDYANGWQEYEWRWKARDFTSPPRHFFQPPWTGTDLAGRTLFVHAEQGVGDTLQFVRYLPLVAARGGRVILEANPELTRLLSANAVAPQILSRGDPLPPFDFHIPLLSLPRIFGTTLATIPASPSYLHADPSLAAGWREKLAALSPRPKVGLAWAGNPQLKFDHLRSPRQLSLLAPLADAPVDFISLQKGPPAEQTKNPPKKMNLHDFTSQLTDFSDTAALVAGLDLVISSDTAVIHLAGALGKPVWTLLPFIPDWRWQLAGENSPWYPTMRLFRQPRPGDWATPISQAAAALRRHVSEIHSASRNVT
jgi:Tfp pilus assembly protein PilF